MKIQSFADGVLVESWDNESRTYTDHRTGATRPYTADENAAADQAAAAATLAANEKALRNGLQAAIDAALARQAAYQAVIDTPNATIKTNPAPYIVDLARQGKRSERALIRLIRLVGGLTTTADTGTD